MRTNVAPAPVHTHEGGIASRVTPTEELRRTVMACMLFEQTFYEAGESVAERIKRLVPLCSPTDVAQMAVDARNRQRLRHAPLLLVRELARNPNRCPDGLVAATLCEVIQRADEPAEFLAMYWSDVKDADPRARRPIAKQVKKGLACAFQKFNEYHLAKYASRPGSVKLRDVLFMVHAKPKDDEQAALWKRLVGGTLAPAGTWEERLSSGENKREAFESLLRENKLGYLALLRNLRNMQQAEVDQSLVFAALSEGAAKSKALPFRYVAAARAVPAWEPQIDAAMQAAMAGMEKLQGSTVVLIDVSGSMESPLSAKSDLSRMDAAAALGSLVRGVCEDVRVFTFSDQVAEVPTRAGMALIDAIVSSQPHIGTYLGAAVDAVRKHAKADRMIVITDEQSHDSVGKPSGRGYMVNVATNERGVGYGDWTHIHGFSEAIVSYIIESEKVASA